MSNIQRISQNNQSSSSNRKFSRLFKGFLIFGFIGSYALYRFLFQIKNIDCIYDAYQEITINVNRPLVQNQSLSAYEGNNNNLTTAGKAFIGTGQVLMDLWIAVIGLVWIIKIKNLRVFAAIGVFFLIRALIFLNIQKLPFPQYLAWRAPGFFSFTVPYEHTRDFYYSGHTGSLFLIFLEFMHIDLKILFILSFLSLLFMMNMLVITRVHYMIDIIGALVIAIWLYRQSIRYVPYVDKLFSLPMVLARKIYQKCSNKTEQQKPQVAKKVTKVQKLIIQQIPQDSPKVGPQDHKNIIQPLQIQYVASAQRIRY